MRDGSGNVSLDEKSSVRSYLGVARLGRGTLPVAEEGCECLFPS